MQSALRDTFVVVIAEIYCEFFYSIHAFRVDTNLNDTVWSSVMKLILIVD